MRSSFWRPILCLGVGLFCAGLARAEPLTGVTAGPPPDWVKPVELPAIGPGKESPTGQNFLLLDHQVNVGAAELYFHRAFQIVSDEGRSEGAQLTIGFDPSFQSLTIHHLRLIRGATVIDLLDLSKLQLLQQERDLDRQLYNGQRTAFQILDDVRVGDVIDLAYTIRGRNPVFGGRYIDTFYLGWGVPVSELRCRVLAPDNRAIQHHVRGTSSATFTESHSAGQHEMLWVCHDLPAIETESNIPPWHVVFPFLELTEFESWAAVADWALPMYALKPESGPLVRETAATLNQPGLTAESRAVAALRFVQEEVRYLGIEMGPGSHQPSDPEDVLRRRFGDCKDKARLLVALLRELGLDAAPVLVHSSHSVSVHEWLPSPFAFDHVVVRLNLDHRSYILDPTMSHQRGADLNVRNVGTYGPYLLLAPGTQALADAPGTRGDQYRNVISEDFTVLALEQPAILTVLTTADGRAADGLRGYFASHSRDQISRAYLDYYTHYYPGISTTQPVEYRDQPDLNRVQVTEHYKIKDLFVRTGNNPVLKAEFYPSTIGEYVRLPNLNERKYPFAVNFPVHTEYITVVHLPEPWNLRKAGDHIVDPAFELKTSSSVGTGKTVWFKYEWETTYPAVPVARLPEFTAHIQQAKQTLGYTLTYNTAAPKAGSFAPNWPMIALALAVLALSSFASWRLVRRRNPEPVPPLLPVAPAHSTYAYNPAPVQTLEGLGGWLVLVCIGLLVRPLYLLYALGKGFRAYFNLTTWQILTDPGFKSYQPEYSFVLPVELSFSLLLLVADVMLVILYFRRSYIFPRAMQIYLGASVLLSLVFFANSNLLIHPPDTTPEQFINHYKMIFQTVVAGAIWIPYFQVSRRVKLTFTR